MKWRYKNRFLYALSLCLLIHLFAYCYYIQPEYQLLSELKYKQNTLQNKRLMQKPILNEEKNEHEILDLTSHETTKRLALLLNQVHLQGLKLEVLSHLPDTTEQKNSSMFSLTLKGSYQALVAFFHALYNEKLGFYIGNFTMEKQDQKEVIFKADFLQGDQSESQKALMSNEVAKYVSPFCQEGQGNLNQVEIIKKISIQQMRMVGYLQKEKEQVAFLLLPDWTLASVEIGDVIGLENAKVSEITENETRLHLPDQQEKILIMHRI